MKKSTENWLKIAKRDLKYAKDNLTIGNYILSIEKSHSALEKLLKALIIEQGQIPSRVHNLLKLAGEALINNLQEDIKAFLDELSDSYIPTRYPDDFDELEKKYNFETSSKIIYETERIFKWLEKKIT